MPPLRPPRGSARGSRGGLAALLCAAVAIATVGACGDATPSMSAGPAPAVTPTATPVPSPPAAGAFWSIASRAMAVTARLRVVVVGGAPDAPDEYRFEPRASAALLDGELVAVCVDGRLYDVDGFLSTPRPDRAACGTSAFISGFRRSGRPAEGWSPAMPEDRNVRERIAAQGADRWRWEYVGVSRELDGIVRTTLVMDVASGRLLSGTRTDPTGEVRWTFNYTALFTPVQLP